MGITLALVIGASVSSAYADEGAEHVEHRWPALPSDHNLSLEDQITDHLTELGNLIGTHMTVLSDHLLAVRVDGRHNRASFRVGGGNVRYLAFKMDSDWL